MLRISRNPAHTRNLSQTTISERFYAFKVKEENLAPNAEKKRLDSLERLKNPSTPLQELTLKIHTNKPCSLEWNLIKMTKIPQQSKTFQNAAPLNPVSNKAQQLLLDPNLSLPRNTDTSLQKQTPGFLTELVFPAKPFQVLKETSVTQHIHSSASARKAFHLEGLAVFEMYYSVISQKISGLN